MLTAYDFPTAKLMDGIVDIILVGDSYGMVVLGYENTTKVTIEDMVRATGAVARGAKNALIVGDMPILLPGIGAQGGEVESTVTAGKDSRGWGMIVNSSRGIIFASKGADFPQAARTAAQPRPPPAARCGTANFLRPRHRPG